MSFARVLPERGTSDDAVLLVEVGGAHIRVRDGFDAELLRRVVRALSEDES